MGKRDYNYNEWARRHGFSSWSDYLAVSISRRRRLYKGFRVWLIEQMERQGLSQAGIIKKFRQRGYNLPKQTIHSWCSGISQPSRRYRRCLAEVLNVKEEELSAFIKTAHDRYCF